MFDNSTTRTWDGVNTVMLFVLCSAAVQHVCLFACACMLVLNTNALFSPLCYANQMSLSVRTRTTTGVVCLWCVSLQPVSLNRTLHEHLCAHNKHQVPPHTYTHVHIHSLNCTLLHNILHIVHIEQPSGQTWHF